MSRRRTVLTIPEMEVAIGNTITALDACQSFRWSIPGKCGVVTDFSGRVYVIRIRQIIGNTRYVRPKAPIRTRATFTVTHNSVGKVRVK